MKRVVLYTFLVVIIGLPSCISKKKSAVTQTTTPVESNSANANHWTIKNYHNDMCFPGGYSDDISSVDSMKVLVYNRWGQKIYKSTSFNENWVCNTGEAFDYLPGIYVYALTIYLYGRDEPLESTGTITLSKIQ